MAQLVMPVFHIILCLDLVFTMVVNVYITRNVKHPGPEITLSAKEVFVFQYPEECVLNEILAEFLFSVHTIKETIQGSFIAFKEQPKLVQVSIPDLSH